MAETSIFLAGNLTDDPELRYTTSRTARATFRVAVSGRVRDGDGWKDGEASFFTVVVWRDQAEHAAGSLAKGSWVVVVGRLAQRSWQAFESEDCSPEREHCCAATPVAGDRVLGAVTRSGHRRAGLSRPCRWVSSRSPGRSGEVAMAYWLLHRDRQGPGPHP